MERGVVFLLPNAEESSRGFFRHGLASDTVLRDGLDTADTLPDETFPINSTRWLAEDYEQG